MLTVVLATRDRAEILRRTLSAFETLHAPSGGWKLIVVDNGSVDQTSAVISDATQRLPITHLKETKPGKNHALNTAIPEIAGDLAVFTDDDVLPQPDWLIKLRAVADSLPDYHLFGGTIDAAWPSHEPEWVKSWGVPIGPVFALQRRPTGPCPAGRIWGANMMVRRELFNEGLFDTAVGPDGTPNYAQGSETEFTLRMEAKGYSAYFAEDAVVRHIIRPEQLTEAWLYGRAYRFGIGGRKARKPAPRRRSVRFFGVGPRTALGLIWFWALSPLARLLPPSRARFRILWGYNWYRGYARGMREQSGRA